jgi:hypothetical protein
MTEIKATPGPVKQVICKQNPDPAVRQIIYERRLAEWMEACEQLADINNSPYYGSAYGGGHAWRVD